MSREASVSIPMNPAAQGYKRTEGIVAEGEYIMVSQTQFIQKDGGLQYVLLKNLDT